MTNVSDTLATIIKDAEEKYKGNAAICKYIYDIKKTLFQYSWDCGLFWDIDIAWENWPHYKDSPDLDTLYDVLVSMDVDYDSGGYYEHLHSHLVNDLQCISDEERDCGVWYNGLPLADR